MPSDTCPTCGDTSPLDECPDCGAYPSRPAPTDTDTAIPAGECHECGGNGYDGGRIPEQEEFQGEYDFACYPCGGTGKAAASPKPDTDTAVDPGVEGVIARLRDAFGGAVFINEFTENGHRQVEHTDACDNLEGLAREIVAALAAKPIAGMDAGEVEGLRDRLAGGTANAYPMMFPALATNQEDGK